MAAKESTADTNTAAKLTEAEAQLRQAYHQHRIRSSASEAVAHLAKLIGGRIDDAPRDNLRHLQNAQRYMDEALASISPAPPVPDEVAALSALFHSFLRKCDDTPVSSLLYRWINRNRGMRAWLAFIGSIHAAQAAAGSVSVRAVGVALRAADAAAEASSCDDEEMTLLLRTWVTHDMVTSVMEWGK